MGYYLKGNKKAKILARKYKGNILYNDRPISDILPSGSWAGHRCFLIGGGPSLEYFHFEWLEGEYTIGVNKAFIKCFSTVNYAMDPLVYNYAMNWEDNVTKEEKARELWKAFDGIKLFLDKEKIDADDVYYVRRILSKTISFDLEKGIYPGRNSGFGALMLALALGANPIYLLGYDMKVQKDKSHWHKGYPKQSLKRTQAKLSRFKTEYEEFAQNIERQGFTVINLVVNSNEDSDLNCFAKQNVREVFQAARV